MSDTIARVLAGIAILLFLFLAWMGLSGAFTQFSNETLTTGQLLQTSMQLAFGVLSLVSLVTWFWARRWSRPVLIGWSLSLGLAGGLAPVVWGQSSVLSGVVAGVASVLVALGIIWLLRLSARGTPT
jgi:hypothetical protein